MVSSTEVLLILRSPTKGVSKLLSARTEVEKQIRITMRIERCSLSVLANRNPDIKTLVRASNKLLTLTTLSSVKNLEKSTNVNRKSRLILIPEIMNADKKEVANLTTLVPPHLFTPNDQFTTQFRGKSEGRVSLEEVVAVVVGNITIKTTASGSSIQSITVTGFKNSRIPEQICGRRSSLTTLQKELETSKTSVANKLVKSSEEATATRVVTSMSFTAKMLEMLTPTK